MLLHDIDYTLHDYAHRSEEPSDPPRPLNMQEKVKHKTQASKRSLKSAPQARKLGKDPAKPTEAEKSKVKRLKVNSKVVCPTVRKFNKGTVQKVEEHDAVFVHYTGWDREHDEWKLLAEYVYSTRTNTFRTIYTRRTMDLEGGQLRSFDDVRVGQNVRVRWNSNTYLAVVSRLYNGPLAFVKYDSLGKRWNRWLRPQQILQIL
jgi:hypothetical protein